MGDLRPLVAVIFTVNYDVLLYTLPAVALIAGLALIVFYAKKTIPEMVAIFVGLFLILSCVSLSALHFIFKVHVGRVEVVRYTGEGPPGGRNGHPVPAPRLSIRG